MFILIRLKIIFILTILFSFINYSNITFASDDTRWLWSYSTAETTVTVDKNTLTNNSDGSISFWSRIASYNGDNAIIEMTRYTLYANKKRIKNISPTIIYYNHMQKKLSGFNENALPRLIIPGTHEELVSNTVCDTLNIPHPYIQASIWEWIYSTDTTTYTIDTVNNVYRYIDNGAIVNVKATHPAKIDAKQYICDFTHGTVDGFIPFPNTLEDKIYTHAQILFNANKEKNNG